MPARQCPSERQCTLRSGRSAHHRRQLWRPRAAHLAAPSDQVRLASTLPYRLRLHSRDLTIECCVLRFHIVDAIATPGSRIGSLAQVIDGPDLTRTRATDLTAADHQLPERDHASLKAGSSVCASQHSLSASCLRRIAGDHSPVNSALRQKAVRLLELRKVEHDVIAVSLCRNVPAQPCRRVCLRSWCG